MPVVVGVRFKDSGKIYHFDPGDLALVQGQEVIVETVRGQELAKIAFANTELAESELVGELKPVVRHAEAADFERMKQLQTRHDEVLLRCKEKVEQHALPMRLVKAEYSFDGSRLTFYFTAEKRVDFRMLVRDLARTFKTRIELRQIGPRDEAKLLGGIGPCGRLLCCATFLPDYARVSIKMAKDQDLPLNPSKISGVCGRLLCCLSYEHETYIAIKNEFPKVGAWVHTPHGPGEVLGVNVVRETATVAVEGMDEQLELRADELREAGMRVSGEARARAARGEGAPITRQRRPEQPADEAGGDVMESLNLLDQGQATLGDAVPPQAQPGRPQRPGQRPERHEREGYKATSPPPRPPAEATAPAPDETAAEMQRKRSRQRRRKKPE
jgi:cell fate regulator YaaT (PSP1 superfamily)